MATNRRQFLFLAAGAGGLAALGLAAWDRRRAGRAVAGPLPAAAGPAAGLLAAQRSSRALGSEITMLALHERLETAEAALDDAFNELEKVEQVMSIYRPASQLCQLNREGTLERPHPYLVEVLTCAQETAARSNGAFDATVQPLWELYAEAKKSGGLPCDEALALAVSKVGWEKLTVTPERIRLAEKGMAVTLNGIAQGYAADRALAALRARGISHALVNTGEVGSLGRKADGEPWRVGIQHPRKPDAFLGVATLEGRCLSTSGDYATTFSPDFVFNHIFNPRTGRSPQHFSSVTVVAPTGMLSDALTKVVFVGGEEAGMALAEKTPGVDLFLVRKDGKTRSSKGFPLAV